MASFATLASSTAYLTLLTQINDRDIDLAKGLDPAFTTVTSPATNSVRFNSANKRYETYNGSAWVELIVAATDAFNMTVTGLRGGNIYGSVTNSGTITGGTINATTLQVSGSAVWTAASLTNLNQLTNGPAFITASALSPYAPLASPTLTGVPAAPTAAVDTSTTQLATTQYVVNQGYLKASTAGTTYAPLASPTLTGVPAAPTAAVDTNTTQIATTQYVVGQGYLKSSTASATYAPLASPSLTGTPVAPTAAVDTNTTQLATTAYVVGQGYLKSATASSTYLPLTGGTVTGATNLASTSGSVGIGTASPAGKLEVKGGTSLTTLTTWNSGANTVFSLANPAVRLGIGYDAADMPLIQGFDTGNGSRNIGMQPYGGSVGIGTSSPSSKLDIGGTATSERLTFSQTSGNTGARQMLAIGYKTAAYSGGTVISGVTESVFDDQLGLRFYTGSGLPERMRIDASGNVGIGTTSPLAPLHVIGDSGINASNAAYPGPTTTIAARIAPDSKADTSGQPGLDMRRWTGGGTTHYTGRIAVDGASSSLLFCVDTQATNTMSTTERMRIDGSGLVGIGAASGGMKLFVSGSSGSTSIGVQESSASGYSSIRLQNGNTVPAALGAALHHMGSSYAASAEYAPDGTSLTGFGTGGVFINATNASGVIKMTTNGVERVRIDSSGTLAAAGNLTVAGTAKSVGSGNFGGSAIGYSFVHQGADANPYFYKLCTLPASTAGTFDVLKIDAIVNTGWGAVSSQVLSIYMGNRSGFTARLMSANGDTITGSKILAYTEADGSVSVYAWMAGSTYSSAHVNLQAQVTAGFPGVTIYNAPTAATSATGTLSFDSSTATPHISVASSGVVSVGVSISGAGTGLTGTAGSLNIGGNAATASVTAMASGRSDPTPYPVVWGTTGATSQLYSCSAVTIQSSTGTLSATALVASGAVSAAGVAGFASTTYAVNSRNPIWRFANADAYGLSYFQGTAGVSSTDTIGIHFGTATAAGSLFQFISTGAFNATGAITQAGNQVLHAGNYNGYAPTLTGTGASGTWGISVTGSAGSVAWANVSSKPINNVTITASTATPTGGSSGDIVFQY